MKERSEEHEKILELYIVYIDEKESGSIDKILYI